MSLSQSIEFFLLAALAFWVTAFPLRHLLVKGGVFDIPQKHASHGRSIPTGGGLLVVIAFFLWWFWIANSLPPLPGMTWAVAGTGAIATMSFIDDLRDQSKRLRFAIYSLAAAGFVAAMLRQEGFANLGPSWLLAIVLWLWVAGFSNAFNFIDGIDGLAATQGITALLFGAAVCAASPGGIDGETAPALISLQLFLAGALAGFLPHNFPKARLFLGDVGSVSTGFLLAVIVVIGAAEFGLRTGLALVALHLGPVLDTSITVFRRLKNGKPIHLRHRDFFFHRAIRSGWSHARVTGIECAIQVAGALLILCVYRTSHSFALLFAAVVVIVMSWLSFFFDCERRFRRSGSGSRDLAG